MLPGYVQKAQDVRAKGIDEIVCITPNDQFVTKVRACPCSHGCSA